MVLLFSTAVQIAAAIIVLNFIVRTIVFTTLKHFGAYDPRWDLKWPRLPWRPFWLRVWIPYTEWKEENFGGGQADAGKAGARTQLALTFEPGQSLIGHTRLPLGIKHYSLIGERSERHKVYMGSARSGKSLQGQSELALMPNDACALVIDPKGDHTHDVLFKLEENGHELCVLDPTSIFPDRPKQQINLIAQMDLINERLEQDRTTEMCDRLASQSFPPNPGEKNPFFTDMGREGWARIICFVKLTIPGATMLDARRLVSAGFAEHAGGDPKLAFAMVWEAMLECEDYDGYVSSFAAQILTMDDRTRESILATIRSKTGYLDHEQVKSVSRGNDVNLCDLKNPDSNLILSIPVNVGDMKTTLRPWIGSILSLSLAIMEWIPGDLNPKTRFIIEEAQAIGEGALPGLGETAALMAGRGVALMVITQDFPGFRKAFPKDYMSVIGNAQHVIFMSCNDPETYEFIANKAFGNKTVKRKKWRMPFLWTVSSWQEPVITPDKVRRRLESGKSNAVVMRNGKKSMFVKIAKSFELLPVWLIDPNRDHGETPARAWFRGGWQEWQQNRSQDSSERVAPEDQAQPLDIETEPQEAPDFVLSKAEAEAVFGLTEPYSNEEITARAKCLNDNFPPALINAAIKELEVRQ